MGKIKERDLMLSGIGSRTKQQQVELPSDFFFKKKEDKRHLFIITRDASINGIMQIVQYN